MIHEALEIFRRVVTPAFIQSCRSGSEVIERAGIYESSIVIWLMLFQRLSSDHTLAKAVEDLRVGYSSRLLEAVRGSIRARARRVSADTGGFSHGRQRVKVELVEQVGDALNSEVIGALSSKSFFDRIYVVDGTTVRLPHTESILEKYPAYYNQHGNAHFPLMRVGVAMHALSGAAVRPSFGPCNGEEAVSEFSLIEDLLPRVPKGSIIVGDRYFGCIRFVLEAQKHGHSSICRVKEKNSRLYIDDSRQGEKQAVWWSKRDKIEVSGRFLWRTIQRNKTKPKERLILFTDDMEISSDQIFEAYALRWNVELDLRDLKTTLDMHELSGRHPDTVAKELILGVTAYNLVRLIMIQLGNRERISVRELSFSRFLKRIMTVSCTMLSSHNETDSQRQKTLVRSLSDLSGLTLPSRVKKRLNEPRKIYRHGRKDFMILSREEERKKLN
jgi:hypothetical protein